MGPSVSAGLGAVQPQENPPSPGKPANSCQTVKIAGLQWIHNTQNPTPTTGNPGPEEGLD